ncbi:MAG TPA: MFS transporter [Candidatus Nitrosocosmicus sp.]
MTEEGKSEKKEHYLLSGLRPFRDSLYRLLWFATVFSYIGSAMYEVGASWLMASIAPNPLLVSLITTTSTLPIFLFAVPSGAVSDIFDRRKILLITCGYMFVVSLILGIFTLLGITTPFLLLLFTFALGAGITMIRTPILPAMSALVSKSDLPSALTLSAVASNIGRAVGPTIGGLVVTLFAPWAAFFLNSLSFIFMMGVIIRLPKKSKSSALPPENIFGAIRAQLRYVRYSQAAVTLIVRSILFTFCSSPLLSLLPLLAKHEMHIDSAGFGLLLGSFGLGAIFGGIVVLPKLSGRFSIESFLTISIGVLSLVMFSVGFIRDFVILCAIMGIGGISYVTILSKLYTVGMKSAPSWIGSRVLAVYLLVLNGGLAVGSVIWGTTANIIGIPFTLSIASLFLGATIIARRYYSTDFINKLDFTPASNDHWSLPSHLVVEPSNSGSQTLITIEYRIDTRLFVEFEQTVYELGRLLRSEGLAYWELFQDPADVSHYVEIRIADTWTDHMRHHERVTKNVQSLENKITHLLKDGPKPVISHYLAKSDFIKK